MKLHRTARSVVGLALVAVLSAGVATVVATADPTSNADPGAATSGVRVGAQSPTESNFVSLRPCRLVDTRQPGAGGALAVREIRNYRTQGNTASQGGATNCGVPATATALEVSVTAVSATGTGFLRLYPNSGGEPNATFMNYTPTFNASNAGTVAVAPGSGDNLRIRNYGGTTQIVVEVLGYYVENPMAVVQANGNLVRGTAGATSSRQSTGVYRVNFDRDVSGCAFSAGPHDPSTGFGGEGYVTLAVNGDDPRGIFVQTISAANAAADLKFHVIVTC